MSKNPYFAGTSEMTARLAEFSKSVPSMVDQALFEAFRAIEVSKEGAKTGNGEGETEDLLYKGITLEAEINRRFGRGLLPYHEWLKRFAGDT